MTTPQETMVSLRANMGSTIEMRGPVQNSAQVEKVEDTVLAALSPLPVHKFLSLVSIHKGTIPAILVGVGMLVLEIRSRHI